MLALDAEGGGGVQDGGGFGVELMGGGEEGEGEEEGGGGRGVEGGEDESEGFCGLGLVESGEVEGRGAGDGGCVVGGAGESVREGVVGLVGAEFVVARGVSHHELVGEESDGQGAEEELVDIVADFEREAEEAWF